MNENKHTTNIDIHIGKYIQTAYTADEASYLVFYTNILTTTFTILFPHINAYK